jgi:hypothetical protein
MAAEREPGLHVRMKDVEGTLKLTDGRLRSHALSELCRTLVLPLDMSVLGLALPTPGGPIVPAYMLAAFAAACDSIGGTWDAIVGAPAYLEHPIAAPPYLPCAFDWLHLAALDMPPACMGARQLLAACHTSVEVYRAFALCGYTVVRGGPGSTAIAALAQQHACDYFADDCRADRRELELGRNKFAGYSRQGARQLLQLRAVRFSGVRAEQCEAYEAASLSPSSSRATPEGEPSCGHLNADVLKAALLPGRSTLSTADAEVAAASTLAAGPLEAGLAAPHPTTAAMAHSFTAAFDMLNTLARLLLRVVALGLACELRGALSGVELARSAPRPCLITLHERCCSHLCGLLDAVAPPWRVGADGEGSSSSGAAAGAVGLCATGADTAPAGVADSTLSQPLAPGVAHVGVDVLRVYQYYRPPDSALPGVSGAATGIHCDMGLLTVSPRSSLPGLRVLHPGTMQWMDVETDMGEHDLAAFAGECLPRAVSTLRAQLMREGPAAFQRRGPSAETPHCVCGCQDDASSSAAPAAPPLPVPALPPPLDLPRAPLHYVDERYPGAPRISTPFFLRARPEAAFADGLAVAAFVEGEVMLHRPWRKRAASAAGAGAEGSGSESVAPPLRLAVRASLRGTDY